MAGLGFATEDTGVIPSPLLNPAGSVPADNSVTPLSNQAVPAAPTAPAPITPPAAPEQPNFLQRLANVGTTIPQWNDNPIGAIGFVLSNVAAGVRGQELPSTKLAAQQVQQQQLRLQQLNVGVNAIDHGLKIAQGLPVDQRAGFIEGYGANFEPHLAGFTQTLKMAAATPGADAIIKALPQYAGVLPNASPEQLVGMLTNKDQRALLDQLADQKFGVTAVSKLQSWEAAIEKVYPGGLASLRDPNTNLLNIPEATAQMINGQIAKANPDFAMSPGELGYVFRHAAEMGITPATLPSETAKAAATTPQKFIEKTTETGSKVETPVPTVGPNVGRSTTMIPTAPPPGTPTLEGTDLTGQDYLNALPDARKSVVQSYVEGRLPLPTGRAAGTPDAQRLLADIQKVDPTYSAQRYETRQQFLKPGTTTANTVNSVNLAIGHMGELSAAVDGLDNNSVRFLNQGQNWIKEQTGNPSIVKLQTAANAVSSELVRAFRGSEGAEADINRWNDLLNNSRSPEQLKGVIEEGVKLLASRMDTLTAQYQRGMWPNAKIDLLTPQARTTLQKLPGGTDIMQSTAAGTATSPIHPATSAAQGAQGSPIAALPPGSQYIGTSNGKPVYQTPDGRRVVQQ